MKTPSRGRCEKLNWGKRADCLWRKRTHEKEWECIFDNRGTLLVRGRYFQDSDSIYIPAPTLDEMSEWLRKRDIDFYIKKNHIEFYDIRAYICCIQIKSSIVNAVADGIIELKKQLAIERGGEGKNVSEY